MTVLIKTSEAKENFSDNHTHNNLRRFDGWANSTSQTNCDY